MFYLCNTASFKKIQFNQSTTSLNLTRLIIRLSHDFQKANHFISSSCDPHIVWLFVWFFRYGVLFLFVFYLQRNSSPSCRALLWTPGTPMFPPGLRRCSLLVCHSSISQHKAGTNTRALHSTSSSNTASLPGHKNKTYAVRALKKIKVYPD